MTATVEVNGADLRVGDTIEVWWANHRDTITAMSPYTGPLACLKGARIAEFALFKTGMTIEPGSRHVLLNRTPSSLGSAAIGTPARGNPHDATAQR